MLFHEVYSAYYNAVAAILTQAGDTGLTRETVSAVVREKAFSESLLTIPEALRDGSWPLLDSETGKSRLKHAPAMPLTLLEKRWLKAILLDPRIALFAPEEKGLEDIEPLFTPQDIVYFDRYLDGDPFTDAGYIERFRTILQALREKRRLSVGFTAGHGKRHLWQCIPCRLEYSMQDDKFRLEVVTRGSRCFINLARIDRVMLKEACEEKKLKVQRLKKNQALLELTDERNALERAMLHFSYLEKETRRIDETKYHILLRYPAEDETEILIRILSFGPMLRVLEPETLKLRLMERLQKQRELLK